ncbi:hypothetical protein N7519_009086 [Penicillium mononematosum]|uniref:uncharacterized protein n=1 Tax=Penicillium mononematosum TaxID=268346 RepID=UPI0025476E50|nr:uncharacterized protein N7519_009086 [Penicillium mononematosum]KAJ6178625.1 hypothetical protein N7519_009086 [Penicillium mononematosum]
MAPPPGCGVCGKQDGLLRCSGCKAMMYCGVEHQIAHRKEHWSACSAIRKSRFAIEKNRPYGASATFRTRFYKKFHCDLCDAMGSVNRFESFIAQVDRLMEEERFRRAPIDGSRDGDLESSRARETPLSA